MTGILKEIWTDTEQRLPCEDRHRLNNASVKIMHLDSQRLSRIASNHQKFGDKNGKDFSLELPEDQLCQHIDFRLLASRILQRENTFYCFEMSSLRYFVMAALGN